MVPKNIVQSLQRRQFIAGILKSTATVISSSGIKPGIAAAGALALTGCGGGHIEGEFEHGVASGDPLSDLSLIHI